MEPILRTFRSNGGGPHIPAQADGVSSEKAARAAFDGS